MPLQDAEALKPLLVVGAFSILFYTRISASSPASLAVSV